jgi:hypothetical protein
MSNTLTQQEADMLLVLEKHYRGNERYIFPSFGGALRIPLSSSDNREEFVLDISRTTISLKNKFQTRARKTIVLVRIDIGGPSHRNPDDTEIPCPHIHFFKEGFADKWAYPLATHFKNTTDIASVLREFMDFCAIITKPNIQAELFE